MTLAVESGFRGHLIPALLTVAGTLLTGVVVGAFGVYVQLVKVQVVLDDIRQDNQQLREQVSLLDSRIRDIEKSVRMP